MPTLDPAAATGQVYVPNEHDAMPENGLITREHAFAAAQNAVRNQGYAVARHGSTVRDLDLIAVPWQETALTPKDWFVEDEKITEEEAVRRTFARHCMA